MRTYLSVVLLAATSLPAFAGFGDPLPEPGSFALAGLGLGVALWLSRRRK